MQARGNAKFRDGLARYGLPTDKAFGVSVATIKQYGKRLGRDHELAKALWKTGWTDARMLAAFVGEPERVTPREMDAWCREFDKGASDERNFVKKGISWALRHIGHRNAKLHGAAIKLARRLAASEDATKRWVGKDALRDLLRPAVI